MQVLTQKMHDFLDQRKGKDLIRTIHEFRLTFGLSHQETYALYMQWQSA